MNAKEFLDARLMFYKVDTLSLNLNKNFEFLQQNSREPLSFEYGPPSYRKFGFRLFADRRV